MKRWLALAGTVLVFVGLMAGAQSQLETFLVNGSDQTSSIAGNLIPFTAVLVGGGVAMFAGAVSPVQSGRAKPLAFVGGAVWLLTVLGQSAYDNYVVLVEARFASVYVSSLANNAAALPAALLPILVLWIAALLSLLYGLRQLFPQDARGPEALRRAMLTRSLLTIPIFGAIVGSNVYLLATLDLQDETLSPLLILAPMAIVSAAALLVVQQVRMWNFGLALEDPRLGPMMLQSWRNLNLIERVAIAVFVLACIGGFVLPKTNMDLLNQGRSFVTTIRTFVVFQILALIPLVPLWRAQQRAERTLYHQHYHALPSIHKQLVTVSVLTGWALLVLVGGPWLIERGIWVVILAFTPMAIFATLTRGAQGALLALVAGGLWWSAGNSFFAIHDPEAFVLLNFDVLPGIQAVVRVVGVSLFAVGCYRIMQQFAPSGAKWGALPLAASFGIALALLIEVSLSIWIIQDQTHPAVGVGSFIQSQGAFFKFFFHAVAFLALMGAGLAWAALMRPEWFEPKTPEPMEPRGSEHS